MVLCDIQRVILGMHKANFLSSYAAVRRHTWKSKTFSDDFSNDVTKQQVVVVLLQATKIVRELRDGSLA